MDVRPVLRVLPYNPPMAVYKRKYPSGKITWGYIFDAPGSTKANRRQIKESPFGTKKEAQDAEAKRRIEAQEEYEATLRGALAPPPATLRSLIEEFCNEHGDKNLAPKTVERYRQTVTYIDADLLSMRITEITPLHLTREWNRLREKGGHHRKTKNARPLSGKTVRNIAGVVSSAYSRAIRWGLATANPVTHSDLPAVRHKEGIALTPAQQDLLALRCRGALGVADHPESLRCDGRAPRRGHCTPLVGYSRRQDIYFSVSDADKKPARIQNS